MNNYFTFTEGAVSFVYYPDIQMVKVVNQLSFFRSIEFFAYRGFFIDWNRSNINTFTLFLIVPDYLEGHRANSIITRATNDLYNQAKEDEARRREERIKGNVDNNTGNIITFPVIESSLRSLKRSNKSRQGIVDWFNRYNLEEIRPPDFPLMRVSTKPVNVLIEEGKASIRKLFDQGKLRKLTKEQYQEKLLKYDQKDNIEKEVDKT